MNGKTGCKIGPGERLQRNWKSKSSNAFTLIELLVVVAILFVLAAFLLSSLGRTRGKIQRAGCANNLRQFGIAASLYSGDAGRLPSILGWLYAETTTLQADISTGQLYPYLRSKSVYLCPVRQSQTGSTPAGNGAPRSDHSYSMNCEMCHAHDSSACLTPSKTIFFVETTNYVPAVVGGLSGPIEITPPGSFNPFLPGFPHQQDSNFLMIDGHIRRMTPKQMNSEAMTPETWYPNSEHEYRGTP